MNGEFVLDKVSQEVQSEIINGPNLEKRKLEKPSIDASNFPQKKNPENERRKSLNTFLPEAEANTMFSEEHQSPGTLPVFSAIDSSPDRKNYRSHKPSASIKIPKCHLLKEKRTLPAEALPLTEELDKLSQGDEQFKTLFMSQLPSLDS